MYLFALLLLALGVHYRAVHGDCQLTQDDVVGSSAVFALRQNNDYTLLRKETVPVGQTLYLICDGSIDEVKCGTNNIFAPPILKASCKSPIKATLDVVSDSSCPFTMYRVGYKVGSQFLEIYRSCYEDSAIRAHFVVHRTYDYNLVTKRPNQEFTMDGRLNAADAATFAAKSIFARFNEVLDKDQAFIKNGRQLVFDRGHLVPSGDFLFVNNMRSTFKYINAVPQFLSRNRGNWHSIENWVRRQTKVSEPLNVCTGTLDILQLSKKEIFLAGGTKNPIPKWMYKIVKSGSARFVFLIYNSNSKFDTQEPGVSCRVVACPATIKLDSTADDGFSYCCDPDDFLKRIVPNLKNVC